MRLLTRPDVVQWIRGDTSFLGTFANKAAAKRAEDAWGHNLMREARPDLPRNVMWSSVFGEMICRELYEQQGATVVRGRAIQGVKPDWETDDYVLEAKVGTRFTEGTAHEKVLGVPTKYSEVPLTYGKPLHIVCIGRAEDEMFGKWKAGAAECPPNRRKMLDFYQQLGITYVAATSLLG